MRLAAAIAAFAMAIAAPALAAALELKPGKQVALTAKFDGLSAKVSGDGNLKDLARALSANPRARIRIEVYMDPTDANALALSLKRAKALRVRLIALGAPKGSIYVKGLGGTKSLVPSVVEAMKARNRRALARVLAPAPPPQKRKAVTKAAAKPTPRPVAKRAAPEPAKRAPAAAAPTSTPVVAAAPPPPSAPAPAISPRGAALTLNLVYATRAVREDPARSALEQAGADLVKVAHVREPHEFDVLYVTPRTRALAQATLRRSGVGRGARLVEVDAILPPADAMLVLSGR